MRRLRGSKRCGRGWKKSKSGSRGGTGNSSLWDSKISSRILLAKTARSRIGATSIEAIQSKMNKYLKKKIAITHSDNSTFFPCGGLCKKYNKILSVGEPSSKYRVCNHIRMSRMAKSKLTL